VESVIVINPSNTPNASPILTNPPIDRGRLGVIYYHTAAAYDPDGDSLSYQLTTCKSGANQTVPGYMYPDAGLGGSFSISPQGFVTWSAPQQVGEYNFAFVINEWRKTNCNGAYQFIGSVTRDMQVIIKQPTPSTLTIGPLPDTCVVAGTSFSRNISVTSSTIVNLNLLGSASNTMVSNYATINPVNGTGNFTSTFSWNTGCSDAGNQTQEILFSIFESPNNYFKYYSGFRFKIVPPAPVITAVSIDTAMVKLTWNKSACASTIKGYYIYRKTALNSWTHSSCENGVPAYSGFYPIGFNNPTDTSFTDTNFWGITNGSPGNYIVTAVTNDCTESFADTIKAVTYVVGLKENNLDNNTVSVYPNPVLNEINISINRPANEVLTMYLLSVQGQLIFSQTAKASSWLTIPCPSLAPGIYFLRIVNKDGVVTKKIVKE